MADLIIFGSPNSSYVRTARLACEEKGVPYALGAVGENRFEDLKSPEHLGRHPWGRVPVMQHGGFTLYESSAICRYVDEAFDGPALQPAGLVERACMNQWVSAAKDYLATHMLRDYAVEFVFPSGPDGQPNQDKLTASRPVVRQDCEILDRGLAGRTYLAGDQVSIAECMLVPILHYLGTTPGAPELFDGLANLGRWWHAVSARPSFVATVPPMLERAVEVA